MLLNSNSYIDNKTGLFHCKICGKPLQMRVEKMGRIWTPDIPCACKKKELDEIARQQALKEKMIKIRQIKSSGLWNSGLEKYSFANDRKNDIKMQVAKEYVTEWETMRRDGVGFILHGGIGSGKTYMAACIANALMDQGIPVIMTNFSRLLNQLSGVKREYANEYLNSLNNYELMVIDDFGAERNTSYAMEQMFSIIDTRYLSGKPLIITTNLTKEQMIDATDLAMGRLFDRIMERSPFLEVEGASMRDLKSEKAISHVSDLFREVS